MLDSTYEVEVKVPVTDLHNVVSRLTQLGASEIKREIQRDDYFDHPCRSFEATDEAVRVRHSVPISETGLREDSTHGSGEITYKGPKIDTKTKTRIEQSVNVGSVEDARKLLSYLGFKHVATVSKRRVFYQLHDIVVSTDDVAEVGIYIELEKIVLGKELVESARNEVLGLVRRLGLDPATSVRESYLELLLKKSL